ncbi:MAG: Twin-arginine translocation pathway signal [Tardiphaga sp.]|jgi:hypothetical protein|nr:Twin-arginine translocation pathway signal [Tardiphaga sp.]
MIDLHSPLFARAAVVALGIGLAGCAGLGDSYLSGAFVDPAKYEMYDCTQLEAERKAQSTRTAELQGLIDKAKTGTAGTVVSEAVYRNDYISARASAKLAEEAWRRNKCTETPPAIVAPAVAAAAAKPARSR